MSETVDMPMSAYEVKDMGWITLAGDPSAENSVSWVNFPCIPRFRESDPGKPDEYSVPVSTQDLIDAGIKVEEGAYLFASVNCAATQRSEAFPGGFEEVPELTPEQEAEFEAEFFGEQPKE